MKKFKILFVDKDSSRFATFPLVGSFLVDFLKLDERLQILSTKIVKLYSLRSIDLLTLIRCILLGIKNFRIISHSVGC